MATAKTTPAQIIAARKSLKLSVEQFAAYLCAAQGRTVRRWEDGTRPIPQYVDILMELRVAPAIDKWLFDRGIKEWNRRLDEDPPAED